MYKTAVVMTVLGVAGIMGNPEASAQQYRFGMKGGVVVSGMNQVEQSAGGSELDWSRNTSFSSGLFVNRRMVELLSLQLELDYKQIGAHARSSAQPDTKINYEFEYLGFSLMPRLDLFPDARFNPNIMVGPYADLRLESRFSIDQNNNTDPNWIFNNASLGADTREYTNTWVMGLAVAGGIEISTKPVIITLEGRYSSSFHNAFEESIEDLPLNANTALMKLVENAKHEYFSILIGFNFYFGR